MKNERLSYIAMVLTLDSVILEEEILRARRREFQKQHAGMKTVDITKIPPPVIKECSSIVASYGSDSAETMQLVKKYADKIDVVGAIEILRKLHRQRGNTHHIPEQV